MTGLNMDFASALLLQNIISALKDELAKHNISPPMIVMKSYEDLQRFKSIPGSQVTMVWADGRVMIDGVEIGVESSRRWTAADDAAMTRERDRGIA